MTPERDTIGNEGCHREDVLGRWSVSERCCKVLQGITDASQSISQRIITESRIECKVKIGIRRIKGSDRES